MSRKKNMNYFDNVIEESTTISKPMEPSNWVDKEFKYIPVLQLRISCGGGIGGASWYEHVKSPGTLEEFERMSSSSRLIRVTRYDDTSVLINTNNIVEVTPYVMAFADFDSQNPKYPQGVYTLRRLLIDDDVKLTIKP